MFFAINSLKHDPTRICLDKILVTNINLIKIEYLLLSNDDVLGTKKYIYINTYCDVIFDRS